MLNYNFFDMSLFSNSPQLQQLGQIQQIQQMQNQNQNQNLSSFSIFGANNQPQGNNQFGKRSPARPLRPPGQNNPAPSDNSKVSIFGNVHQSPSQNNNLIEGLFVVEDKSENVEEKLTSLLKINRELELKEKEREEMIKSKESSLNQLKNDNEIYRNKNAQLKEKLELSKKKNHQLSDQLQQTKLLMTRQQDVIVDLKAGREMQRLQKVQLEEKLKKQTYYYEQQIEKLKSSSRSSYGIKVEQSMFTLNQKWEDIYLRSENIFNITEKLSANHPKVAANTKNLILDLEQSLMQFISDKLQKLSEAIIDCIETEEKKKRGSLQRLEQLKCSLAKCVDEEKKDIKDQEPDLTEEQIVRIYLPIEQKMEKQNILLQELTKVKEEIKDTLRWKEIQQYLKEAKEREKESRGEEKQVVQEVKKDSNRLNQLQDWMMDENDI